MAFDAVLGCFVRRLFLCYLVLASHGFLCCRDLVLFPFGFSSALRGFLLGMVAEGVLEREGVDNRKGAEYGL